MKPKTTNNSKAFNGNKRYFYTDACIRETLNALKNKYSLSWSTIIDILVNQHPAMCLNLKDKYLQGKNCTTKTTTIKPKLISWNECDQNNYAIMLSNITYIFAYKKWDLLFENMNYEDKKREEEKTKYINKVYSELDKREDKFYDYNDKTRNFTRFIKKNKKYVERLLKQ